MRLCRAAVVSGAIVHEIRCRAAEARITRTAFRLPSVVLVLVLTALPPLAIAGAKPTVDWAAPHESDILLVGFKPSMQRSTRSAVHAARGTKVVRSFNLIPVDVVRIDGSQNLQSLAADYERDPAVDYVEPNFIYHALLRPNDSRFVDQWSFDNTGQQGTSDADIDAVEAWDVGTGSANVIVGVIDSGIDYNHPDLTANMWVNAAEQNGIAGVDDDGNGFIDDIHGADFINGDGDPFDDEWHGTHVAGIIGAVGNNAVGVAGVNHSVRLMALKFLDAAGNGNTVDATAAIQYAAAMGAHLTNNSWGGPARSQTLENAIAAAGILFVAAAGENPPVDQDRVPSFPSSADLAEIISVGASDATDHRANFSNFGRNSIDLFAPGDQILSTWPGGGYDLAGGTSMAAPHVAGVAALLLARTPTASASDLKRWLLDSVDHLQSFKDICVSGGRLNAARAVAHDKAVAVGKSTIKSYRRNPRGRRVAHAAAVRFAPSPSSPFKDWLRHKDKITLYYRSKGYVCVEGVTRAGRSVVGWVKRTQIRSVSLVKKLPPPPADVAQRICEFQEPRGCTIGNLCDINRPDSTMGDPSCGSSEPGTNPCFTTTLCTARRRTPLLLDPYNPALFVRDFKKNSSCSGNKCAEIHSTRWSRVRLRPGQRIGLATDYLGRPSGPTVDTSDGRYVWIRQSPPRSAYRPVLSGWVLRDDICCAGYAAADNPSGCSAPSPGASAGGAAAAASSCTLSCCDGASMNLAASDAQDCYDQALESDACSEGFCGIQDVSFDATTVFSQPCVSCCALCARRSTSHVVAGACEDCEDAAGDYCAVGDRGRLISATIEPWGQCGEDVQGTCRVYCCGGDEFTFPSGSRNECYAEASGADPCGTGDCSGSPAHISFNGEELWADDCDQCCAQCAGSTDYFQVPNVCENCTDEAEAFCNGDLSDARWSQCSVAPICGDGIVTYPTEQCDPPGSTCANGKVCAVDCTCPPCGCQQDCTSDADCDCAGTRCIYACDILTGDCGNKCIPGECKDSCFSDGAICQYSGSSCTFSDCCCLPSCGYCTSPLPFDECFLLFCGAPAETSRAQVLMNAVAAVSEQ